MGILQLFGAGIWLLFIAGGIGAIWLVMKHRRVHRRLGLPTTGNFLDCPMCTDERERRALPLSVRMSRDLKRKRLRREELDSGRR